MTEYISIIQYNSMIQNVSMIQYIRSSTLKCSLVILMACNVPHRQNGHWTCGSEKSMTVLSCISRILSQSYQARILIFGMCRGRIPFKRSYTVSLTEFFIFIIRNYFKQVICVEFNYLPWNMSNTIRKQI